MSLGSYVRVARHYIGQALQSKASLRREMTKIMAARDAHTDKLRALAERDGLTGLYSRKIFSDRLNEELRRARRYGGDCGLIMFDLDHFKNINDSYGHPAGDKILRAVADILAQQIRSSDIAARIGGEEFAVILPQTDKAGSLAEAERLRGLIAGIAREYGNVTLRVTASFGVAAFAENAKTIEELMSCADQALYDAKNSGRNRVVASNQTTLAVAS
ncbi:MAG: GGDEF domain-containing protein [bacterium]